MCCVGVLCRVSLGIVHVVDRRCRGWVEKSSSLVRCTFHEKSFFATSMRTLIPSMPDLSSIPPTLNTLTSPMSLAHLLTYSPMPLTCLVLHV